MFINLKGAVRNLKQGGKRGSVLPNLLSPPIGMTVLLSYYPDCDS